MSEDTKQPTTPATPSEDSPTYVTEKDFQGAMTERMSRLEKKMAKSFDEALSKFRESLTASAPAPSGEQPPTAKKDDPELAALRRRLDDAEKARKAEADARESERQARLRDEESASLVTALRKAGIEDEDLLEGAASMHLRKGAIVRDEQNRVCLKTKDKYGEDKLTPIEEGIKEWAGSSQGKKYLPATGAEGSGTKARPGAAPNGKSDPRHSAAQAILRLTGHPNKGG